MNKHIYYFLLAFILAFGVHTAHASTKHLLPAPRISPQYPTLLVWKWHHKNPYHWNAYLSLDNGKTYQFDDFVDGIGRQYAPDGGTSLFYIVGVDKGGHEITRHSNAVRADDIKTIR